VTDIAGAGLERVEVSNGFVGIVGKSLGVGAVLLALLPIPVTAFELLPTYYAQSRFLLFYAPTICLLTIGYLVYVRDILARFLFHDTLDPTEVDPYYGNQLSRRAWIKIRATILALLPLILIAASLYCVTRYMRRLEQSLAVSGQVVLDRLPAAQRGELLRTPATSALPTVRQDSLRTSGAAPDSVAARRGGTEDLVGTAVDEAALRRYTLRTANIEDIAYFKELTILYIGTFVCAIAASVLMILREHAKTVLGVSEEGLILEAGSELRE
jgi:hypothetical protein